MSSSSSQRCAVCERSFGMLLWKHTCDICHRTVCDDCAPRDTESVTHSGEATKLRVCKSCGTAGRRLSGSTGDATVAKKCSGPGQGSAAAPRPDPNSEAERERRAAIIDARNKSQQNRGRPQGGLAGQSSTLMPLASPLHPPPPAPTNNSNSRATTVTSVSPCSTSPVVASAWKMPEAAPPPPSSPPPETSASKPANPALEAALRRQQQQQARSGSAASASATRMSPEKTKLLCDIEALLAKHNEDPPFGLRASDEAKLKGYLHYLKTKYRVPE
ncbi:hypothetical protein ABL78_3926 [Leptomonas seymouri]|uniref:FYVE-type domain-containing protein n=1 Tax=Leptomonas seymouri TaxID=5684 RepID=A0A0N1I764_LEPSE|nr:hypothetical protein ABL78_3926 [Leptomonas seymouri]|eukprot:KPI87014.1 hypothetical protein ABL78_3926 [Leptomonas seymouri]